jgi:hypothetical protein
LNNVFILPHPGAERIPKRGQANIGWPSISGNARHGRKFLGVCGEWRTMPSGSGRDYIQFWGEYEPPTRCLRLPLVLAGMPRFLQTPTKIVGRPTLNTDPWVFTGGYVWSICRHPPGSFPAKSGDIVLFGSVLGGHWVLDTLLVVGKYVPLRSPSLGRSFATLVAPVVPPNAHPCIGVTPSKSSNYFSFVPAKASKYPQPFSRPAITTLFQQLVMCSTGVPPSQNNARALVKCRPLNGMQSFWDAVVREVQNQGLVLGTQLTLSPVRVSGSRSGYLSCTGRQRC